MNILTLYYVCNVILAMYMLDSDQEPSYNLTKNLLLLSRILKLIEDMVDDSTPLLNVCFYASTIYNRTRFAFNWHHVYKSYKWNQITQKYSMRPKQEVILFV